MISRAPAPELAAMSSVGVPVPELAAMARAAAAVAMVVVAVPAPEALHSWRSIGGRCTW